MIFGVVEVDSVVCLTLDDVDLFAVDVGVAVVSGVAGSFVVG